MMERVIHYALERESLFDEEKSDAHIEEYVKYRMNQEHGIDCMWEDKGENEDGERVISYFVEKTKRLSAGTDDEWIDTYLEMQRNRAGALSVIWCDEGEKLFDSYEQEGR